MLIQNLNISNCCCCCCCFFKERTMENYW